MGWSSGLCLFMNSAAYVNKISSVQTYKHIKPKLNPLTCLLISFCSHQLSGLPIGSSHDLFLYDHFSYNTEVLESGSLHRLSHLVQLFAFCVCNLKLAGGMWDRSGLVWSRKTGAAVRAASSLHLKIVVSKPGGVNDGWAERQHSRRDSGPSICLLSFLLRRPLTGRLVPVSAPSLSVSLLRSKVACEFSVVSAGF